MIIGLTGKKGSGKSEVAKYLTRAEDYTEISLAEPIREALYRLDPIIEGVETSNGGVVHVGLCDVIDAIGWDAAKREYPEVRRLMQVFGTEVGREQFGPDVWVHKAYEAILNVPFAPLRERNVVISDVRFFNEANSVQGLNWLDGGPGVIVRVESDVVGEGDGDSHASEREQVGIKADYVLHNNGTDLLDLHDNIARMMEHLRA